MAAGTARAQALRELPCDPERLVEPALLPQIDPLKQALAGVKARMADAADTSWPRVTAPDPGVWLESAVADTARILTPEGPKSVGSLMPGDLVTTKDAGPLPLRWIGKHALSAQQLAEHPGLCPILVREGALSANFPRRPLYVSPRAHLLMRPKTAAPGESCLVPADALSQNPKICRALPRGSLRYCQLMFDVHALVFIEGLEMDSFHPAGLRPTPEARHIWAEVLGVFPGLEHGMDTYGPLARPRVMH